LKGGLRNKKLEDNNASSEKQNTSKPITGWEINGIHNNTSPRKNNALAKGGIRDKWRKDLTTDKSRGKNQRGRKKGGSFKKGKKRSGQNVQ